VDRKEETLRPGGKTFGDKAGLRLSRTVQLHLLSGRAARPN